MEKKKYRIKIISNVKFIPQVLVNEIGTKEYWEGDTVFFSFENAYKHLKRHADGEVRYVYVNI